MRDTKLPYVSFLRVWGTIGRLTLQKKLIVDALGSKEAAIEHRTAVYLGGAAIAE